MMPCFISSSTAKTISKIPLQLSRFRTFSHIPFSDYTKQSFTYDHKNSAFTHQQSPEMEKSIYIMLTLDRWDSLNHMEYRLASLRPVHGRLTLKFLNWVIKQPGLELNHLTHILSISTHILVRARMYEAAKSILRRLSKLGVGSKSVFDALMNTYPLCKSNPSVFDLLIRVYLREGMVIDALETFYLMGSRRFNPSVYTCNMLLGSVVKERRLGAGRVAEAEDFMRHMSTIDLAPNSITFDCIINGYGILGDALKAFSMFDEMIKLGHYPSHFTYGSLLKGLCKGGNLREAKKLLYKLRHIPAAVDTNIYNTILTETCKRGKLKGKMVPALLFFEKALARGTLSPNKVMYTSLFDGLFKVGQSNAASYIYEEMEHKGINPDTIAINAVLDGYSKMGKMEKVDKLFIKMQSGSLTPSLATYNILLHGYSKKKDLLKCSKFYNIMTRMGISPDKLTCHSIILGLCKSGMLDVGFKMLKKMIMEDTLVDQLTLNMLITNSCETDKMGKAFDLLNIMNILGIIPDVNTYNAIFTGLNRASAFRESHLLLHDMLERGITPTSTQYISLINGMCRMGDIQGAFRLKDEMESIGVSSWDVAESAMVRGLAQCGKVEEAMLVLDCMLQKRLIPTIATFTTLMHMLCKKAKLSEALKLRGIMALYGVKLDVVAYNVLISGLCADGDALAAFKLYEEMKERGLWPNTTTYCTLIDAISTNGVSLIQSGILLKDLQERGMISRNFNGSTDEGLITAMKNRLGAMVLMFEAFSNANLNVGAGNWNWQNQLEMRSCGLLQLTDPGKNSKGGGSSILPRRDEDGLRGNQIKGKIQVLLQAWQTESSNIKRDRVAMIDFVDINCTRVVNLKGSMRMRSKRTSTEGYA
ncbi:hypothetical protein D5086_003227 [Populus alba]|uniref:Uncharacterized protein n=1 Tax=Populus alba TaxID=43335 RepID=A0ACC4D5Q6_POPAL